MTTLSDAFSMALSHHQAGRLQEAENIYREILRAAPEQPNALHMLGVLASQAGQQQVAIDHIGRAIKQVPEAGEFHDSLAAVFLAMGDLESALESSRRAVELKPEFAEGHSNLGTALQRLGRCDEAIECFNRALALRPDFAAGHYNLGITLRDQERLEEAEAAYRRALELQPTHAGAQNNLGNVLRELGRLDEAADTFRRVLETEPHHARAHNNLGLALLDLGRVNEAAEAFRRALEIRWDYAEAQHNLGNALKAQERFSEAEAAYRQSLMLENDSAEAHNNLGIALREQARFDEAAESYRRAIEIRQDYGEAYHNLSNIFRGQGRYEEAEALFREAQQAQPEEPLWQLRIATLCPTIFPDSAAMADHRARLREEIDRFTAMNLEFDVDRTNLWGVEPPFNLQFDDGNLRPLKEAYAGIFSRAFDQRSRQPANGSGSQRPRIGIVVTGGHERLFVRSLGPVIERIDSSRFELVVICSPSGALRLRKAAELSSVELLPAAEPFGRIARTIGDARFDVLYYWEIGTDWTNYFLPFLRLAPVQCTSWGIQVTSGIPQVDYYLSSALVEPDDAAEHYCETLLLAETLLSHRERSRVEGTPAREDFGFSEGEHLYLCAHQLGKFHPDFDHLMADILRGDPAGRIVITEDASGYGAQMLRDRLAAREPDVAQRIQFVPRMDREEYLGLTAAVDVLLDPIYFGGVNTSYDGFSLNKPIVTLPSAYHRGRYTAGCYRKMGLDECVAADAENYVETAVRLGTDGDYRRQIEEEIAAASDALFDDDSAVAEHERLFQKLADDARAA